MTESSFSQLEQKVRAAVGLIYRLREENRTLRQRPVVSGAAATGGADTQALRDRIGQLERRIHELEVENQALMANKKQVQEKIELMLQKYDILEL